MTTPWYSEEALRKQVELDRKHETGERPLLTDLLGILEPRVPAIGAERCVHCGSDARPETGGEMYDGKRWCSLCYGRGRHEP